MTQTLNDNAPKIVTQCRYAYHEVSEDKEFRQKYPIIKLLDLANAIKKLFEKYNTFDDIIYDSQPVLRKISNQVIAEFTPQILNTSDEDLKKIEDL